MNTLGMQAPKACSRLGVATAARWGRNTSFGNHIIAWLTESSTSFLRGLVFGEIKIIRFELAFCGNPFAVGQTAGITIARV